MWLGLKLSKSVEFLLAVRILFCLSVTVQILSSGIERLENLPGIMVSILGEHVLKVYNLQKKIKNIR